MPTGTPNTAENFWAGVQRGAPDACWEWQRSRNPRGYGQLKYHGRQTVAHRIAYLLAHGAIADGLSVCHTCDNRVCCNPTHLFLGTHTDNMADMVAKGRQRNGRQPGEQNPGSRLTAAQVAEIRALWAAGGVSKTELGRRFGVTRQNVRLIVSGKAWHAALALGVEIGWEAVAREDDGDQAEAA